MKIFSQWFSKDYTHELMELRRKYEALERKYEDLLWDFKSARLPSSKDYEENGYVRQICMKPKCNQPLFVREYQKFCKERPLLCADCWRTVYVKADMLIFEDSTKSRIAARDEAISDWLNK